MYETARIVKFTPLSEWNKRGWNRHYVIKRLKDSEKILTTHDLDRIKKIEVTFRGKPYDLYFEWSVKRMYCSELVWKIYNRALGVELGKLQKLKSFDLSSIVIQKKLRERFGNKIPYEELIISPARIFNSVQLITVKKE